MNSFEKFLVGLAYGMCIGVVILVCLTLVWG